MTFAGAAAFSGIPNPVVAIKGQHEDGSFRAPNLVLNLDSTGRENVTVSYNLRDIDTSARDSVQPVALQYRIGSSGDFINVPQGFVADASAGPGLTKTTAVSVSLPAWSNISNLQIRIITTDAVGADEWIGIDDITVTSTPPAPSNTAPTFASPGTLLLPENVAEIASLAQYFSDAESSTAELSFAVVGGADAALVTWDDALGGLRFAAAPNYELPVDAGADNLYEITVEASDPEGLSTTGTFLVSITNVAEAPQIASIDLIGAALEGAPVELEATATDPESDIVSYAWKVTRLVEGSVVELPVTATGATATFTPPDSGEYSVELTVTDATGLTSTFSRALTVGDVAPALALGGPPLAVLGEGPYTIALTSTDVGDDTLSRWLVNWGDGTPLESVDASPRTPISGSGAAWATSTEASHLYGAAGGYTITVYAVDEDSGAVDSDHDGIPDGAYAAGTITLLVDERPSVAVGGVPPAKMNHLAVVTGTFTNGSLPAGADPVSLSASIGTIVDHGDGSWTWSYTPTAPGPLAVMISATDSHALVGSAEFTLSVAPDTAPVADAGGPYMIIAGESLLLDARASLDADAGDSIAKYEWDLDGDGAADITGDVSAESGQIAWDLDNDGAPDAFTADARISIPSTGLTTEHSPYTFTLTVTDRFGRSSSDTATVAVQTQDVAVAIGDVDGDGLADLSVTVHDGLDHLLELRFVEGEAGRLVQITDNGTLLASIPATQFPGNIYLVGGAGSERFHLLGNLASDGLREIIISGGEGDDIVSVDVDGFDSEWVFDFDGGAGDDALSIRGRGDSAIYRPADLGGAGEVEIAKHTGADRVVVRFTSLEPVDISGMATVTVAMPETSSNHLVLSAGFDSQTGQIPAIIVSGNTGMGAIEEAHLFDNGQVILDTSATIGGGANSITLASAIGGEGHDHANSNLTLITSTAGEVIFADSLAITGSLVVDSPSAELHADLAAQSLVGEVQHLLVAHAGAKRGSIADAVAIAAPAGRIQIESGLYEEDLDASGKALTIAAGTSPGQVILNGDLTLDDDDVLEIEIDGSSPATGFDNFIVTGAVTLGGAGVTFSGVHAPSLGESLTILDNDAGDEIIGLFADAPEGSLVAINGYTYVLSYRGGDGNDLTLSTGGPAWVNDTWTITADLGAEGLSPGDVVSANAAAGDDEAENLIFGFNAFSSLAEAIGAVGAGGTVIVLAGHYSESIAIDHSVAILGHDTDGPAAIVLESTGDAPSLTIAGAIDVVIDTLAIAGGLTGITIDGANLTLRDSIVTAGASTGVLIEGGAAVEARDTDFIGAGGGTGIIVSEGSLLLEGGRITDREIGLAVSAAASATIRGAVVTSHTTAGIRVDGGAALLESSDLRGNGIGIRALGGALVDAGDLDGLNVSGLGTGSGINGSSAGANLLSGYAGVAGNYAIENLNLVGAGSSDVEAENNDFGSIVATLIEGVLFHAADDPLRTTVHAGSPIATHDPLKPMVVYVDDDWFGTPLAADADTPAGGALGNGVAYGYDQFATLRDALGVVAEGGVIYVYGGLYLENLAIDKSVEIRGINLGLAGSDAARAAEAIIRASAAADAMIEVNASGVTLDGLTIEGTAGVLRGVRVNGADDVALRNNVVTGIAGRAIQFNGAALGNTGGMVERNQIAGLLPGSPLGPTYGVLAYDSSYVSVTDNTMTGVDVGIFEQYFYRSNGAANSPNEISANHITASLLAYGTNERGTGAAATHLADNHYSLGTGGVGIQLSNIYLDEGVTITRDTIDGAEIGIYAYINGGSVSITETTIAGSGATGSIGLHLTNFHEGYAEYETSYSTVNGSISITGGSISSMHTGVLVEDAWADFDGDLVDDAAGTVALEIAGAEITTTVAAGTGVLVKGQAASANLTSATIHGNEIGVDIDEAHARIQSGAIHGNGTGVRVRHGATGELLATSFVGATPNGTDLRLDASAGEVAIGDGNRFGAAELFIDNRSAQSFDLTSHSQTTFGALDRDSIEDGFAIEDRMVHATDEAASGLITWKAASLFVTTPGSGASDESIQNAVDRAVAGDTVHVQGGTYLEDLLIDTPGIVVVGAGPDATILDYAGQAGHNNAGVSIVADEVRLEGLTVTRSGAVGAQPRYGVKVDLVSGVTIENVDISRSFRSGLDLHGVTDVTVNRVRSVENGGAGIFMTDVKGASLGNIETAGNPWAGVSIATSGQYAEVGTRGIVFHGVNHFDESNGDNGGLQLEMHSHAMMKPYTISWSSDPADGADVTIQSADFGYVLGAHSFDAGAGTHRYRRFYQTLAQAESAAAGSPDHYDLAGRYLHEADDSNWFGASEPTTFYVFKNTGATLSIQAAIDAAMPGDTIRIAPGTYEGDIATGPKGIAFLLADGVTIDGDVALSGADTLVFDLGGMAPRSDDDRLIVNGTLNLGGASLELAIEAGYDLGTADGIVIIESNSLVGAFDQYAVGDPPTSLLKIEYDLPGDGEVSLSKLDPPELAADFNRDAVVDAADFTMWRDNRGKKVANFTAGDGNGDGMVDDQDYLVWKANYGRSSAAAETTSAAPAEAAQVEPPTTSALHVSSQAEQHEPSSDRAAAIVSAENYFGGFVVLEPHHTSHWEGAPKNFETGSRASGVESWRLGRANLVVQLPRAWREWHSASFETPRGEGQEALDRAFEAFEGLHPLLERPLEV